MSLNIFRTLANLHSLSPTAGTVDATNGLMVVNSTELFAHLPLPLKLTSVISVVCAEGDVTLDVDLEKCHLTPNTLMVLGPGHTLKGVEVSDDFHGFSVVASLKTLSAALPYMSRVVMCFMHYRNNPVIEISPEETRTQLMYHDLLQRVMLQRDDAEYNDVVIRRLGESLLYRTLGAFSSNIDNTCIAGRKRSDEIYFRFLQLVEQHFKRERSVSYYADRIAVTPKHLSSVIKECSGRTAGDWIDQYVVMEAKIMLSGSDKSIKQIASELNFPNQSFFGKYFKHHTGQSPRQYRNDTFTE